MQTTIAGAIVEVIIIVIVAEVSTKRQKTKNDAQD